jgi:putative Mn2+ efflux pump MntP
LWTVIVLGVSVSIDALGAGFSLLFDFKELIIFQDSLIIGAAASIMTGLSFIIVNYIKHIALVEKYANYIGGTILLMLGINTVLM